MHQVDCTGFDGHAIEVCCTLHIGSYKFGTIKSIVYDVSDLFSIRVSMEQVQTGIRPSHTVDPVKKKGAGSGWTHGNISHFPCVPVRFYLEKNGGGPRSMTGSVSPLKDSPRLLQVGWAQSALAHTMLAPNLECHDVKRIAIKLTNHNNVS